MAKIYRVMVKEADRPLLGETSSTLGVRVPHDVIPDADGQVRPGQGGMSVSPTLSALNRLPARMIPRRLRHVVPSAAGNDSLFAWSLGEGEWPQDQAALVRGLQLRVDPKDGQHGFVEPEAMTTLGQFRQALAATQDQWRVDEE